MINNLLNPQWIYNLVKYSSATLLGLALASTFPNATAQAIATSQTAANQSTRVDITQVAQSITPANDGTGTIVNQTDNAFDITGGTQAGNNLFHSFEQLGLEASETANILSSPDINNILSRVVGGNASVIDGLLQVTGGNANLFLMNPAGIIFGPEAQVLVPGAFTATTANGIQLDKAWFNALGSHDYTTLLGDPSGFAFSSDAPGAVINAGSLVSPGESVTLLGGVVVNTGTIETPGGTINIAAVPGENRVDITPEGSLLTLALPADSQAGLTASSQGFAASDLPALLSGEEIGNTLGVVVDGGVVTLVATDTEIPTAAGTVIASGRLEASDVSANGVGGEIDVLGDRVALLNATLQASGTNGGGLIRVGGDYLGRGLVANAEQTYVNERSTIMADAITTGDGGRVIVWADDTARFYGDISARGGAESGNGGFAEVSGRQNLAFDGTANLDADSGVMGTLLLDPKTITISSRASTAGTEGNLPKIFADDFSEGNITINATALTDQTGDIELQATDGIVIEEGLSLTFAGACIGASACSSIIFNANQDGDEVGSFSMDPTQSILTSGRSITITGVDITVGNIYAYTTPDLSREEPAQLNVILTATGDIETGNIETDYEIEETSTAPVDGTVAISAGGSISIGTEMAPNNILTDDRDIMLMAGDDIVAGNLDSNGFANEGLLDPSSVKLSTTRGDVQVGYIRAGGGGINVTAGGSFRATDSVPVTFDLDENGDSFLNDEGDSIFPSFNFSLYVSPFGEDDLGDSTIPVTISYGGGSREIIPATEFGAIKLVIRGDDTQRFVIGPSEGDGLVLSEGDSGTVAGIGAGGGSNSTLRGTLVSQTYLPPEDDGDSGRVDGRERVRNDGDRESVRNDRARSHCDHDFGNSSNTRSNTLIIDESLAPASEMRLSIDLPCNDEISEATTDSPAARGSGDDGNFSRTVSSTLEP